MALPGSNTKQANDDPQAIIQKDDPAYAAGSADGYRADYSAAVKGTSKGGVNGK